MPFALALPGLLAAILKGGEMVEGSHGENLYGVDGFGPIQGDGMGTGSNLIKDSPREDYEEVDPATP